MSEDTFFEIQALRSQLELVTKERDDAKATSTALSIRVGSEGTHGFTQGYANAQKQAKGIAERMAAAARDVSHRDKECERMHKHAAVAADAIAHQITEMKPTDEA